MHMQMSISLAVHMDCMQRCVEEIHFHEQGAPRYLVKEYSKVRLYISISMINEFVILRVSQTEFDE